MKKEEMEVLIQELEAYRSLDGQPFDFGNGVIENHLSFGSEDVYFKIDIQNLEEAILDLECEIKLFKNKTKKRLNRYKRKKIDQIKLKKLNKMNCMTACYSDRKKRYIKCYYSKFRKLSKKRTSEKIRSCNKAFKLSKCCAYRRVDPQ